MATTTTDEPTPKAQPVMNEHQATALANTAKLLTNPKYYDLTISCHGQEFKVHKAIVCSTSPVLAAECDNPMCEAQSGVINHSEFDADTVERMLAYIYTQEYVLPDGFEVVVPALGAATPGDGKEAATRTLKGFNAKLYTHIRVYAVADFYGVRTLQELAMHNFLDKALTGYFEINGFIEVIGEVYKRTTSTKQTIHRHLRTLAMRHITELTKNKTFMANLSQLEHAQEFAGKLLRSSVKTWNTETATLEKQVAECKELDATQLAERDQENLRLQEANKAESALRAAESLSMKAMLEKDKEAIKRTGEAMQALVDGVGKLTVSCACGGYSLPGHRIMVERLQPSQPGSGEDIWAIKCSGCGTRGCPAKKPKLSEGSKCKLSDE